MAVGCLLRSTYDPFHSAPGKMDVPEVYYRHPGREPKPTLTLQDIAWLKETGEVSKMAAGTPSRYMVKKDPGYGKQRDQVKHHCTGDECSNGCLNSKLVLNLASTQFFVACSTKTA